MDFTLTLPQQRIDYIMNVLAERPWKEANETLQDIGVQVQRQRNPQPQLVTDQKVNGAAKEATQ